jgi:hypothetical protein
VLLFGFDDRRATRWRLAREGRSRSAPTARQCLPGEAVNQRAVFLAGDVEGALEACRRLRLADQTWRTPAVLCLRQPTRERVLRALAQGASHVLRIPADESALLRVLEDSRV